MSLHLRCVTVMALAFGVCACSSTSLHDQQALKQELLNHKRSMATLRVQLKNQIIDRLRLIGKRKIKKSYDILVLSGGGQYGAFGVGVLQGWGQVKGPLARPEFDMVTGVSTGSMIAPFAFIGSDHSFDDISRLYSQADDKFAVLRGLFFFLPWRKSFFQPSGLFTTLEREVDHSVVEKVLEGGKSNRSLLLATTNLDLGVMKVWDVNAQLKELDIAAATKRLHDIMRASCSIPAVFPPHPIDGFLHVDGGTSEQMFMLNDVVRDVVDAQKSDATIPRMPFRIWVVINGKLSPGLSPTSDSWVDVAGRSIKILTHEAMATELRRLELFAKLMDTLAPERFEFRSIAIPETLPMPKTKKLFDQQLMNYLLQEGRKLGRRREWRSHSVAPEELVPAF